MTDFLLKLSVQTTRNVFQKGFKFEPYSKLLGKKTNFMKAWNEDVFVNQRVTVTFFEESEIIVHFILAAKNEN